jgi:hypothetical protein
MSCKMSNRIGNVMISVFASSGIAVDRGFNSMLVVIFGGRVKPKSIKLVFTASLLVRTMLLFRCVFVLFIFILCLEAQHCLYLWIVHFLLPLRISLTFI